MVTDSKSLEGAKAARLIGAFKFPGLLAYPEAPVAKLTEKALAVLSKSGKKFLLMVEGAYIDNGAHENNPEAVVYQTLLFDMAVKAALDFAVADKETLVIVTADHETGGLVVKNGDPTGKEVDISWTHKQHTAMPILLFAYGPGAEMLGGVCDNTDIPKRIAALIGVSGFPKIAE